MKRALAVALGWLGLVSASPPPTVPPHPDDALIQSDALPERLQDLALMRDGLTPMPGVAPYHLNTPLFSDYAEKFRFLYVPNGKHAEVKGDGLLSLPVGSVLIKTFAYPADMRAPERDVRVIETRLLIHRASGWIALPYVWNAEGTEATLRRAGTRMPVSWVHKDGTTRSISYAVPNVNQCKGCHVRAGEMTPIGPKAANMDDGTQLQRLEKAGVLTGKLDSLHRLPAWDRPETGTVAERARAYLEVNCGHCHNRAGPADTSGLWLDRDQVADANLGLNKRPTAAGRGSMGMDFAIKPGDPGQSYLVARMESLEAGIAMPELGRATVHDEGVALIRQWIGEMK